MLDDGISSYLYGPSLAPIAQIDNATGAVQYSHSDLIGFTRVITDSEGAAVDTTQYDEYGNRTAHAYAANNPLQNIDPTGLDFWGDVGNNGLAFGAGLLDSATFGLSSVVLGAVVPGYNCLTEGNPWFTAGMVVGMVAVGLATAGIGAGVVIASIAARTAIKVAVKTAVSASQRVVTGAVVRAPARLGSSATQAAAKTETRLAQDLAISPIAPKPLGLNRPVGRPSHNAALQDDIAALPRGATDVRVNQQQVNALGQRVGVNRPDLQYTTNGQRFYVEYEGVANPRGAAHQLRLLANDPTGNFMLRIVP